MISILYDFGLAFLICFGAIFVSLAVDCILGFFIELIEKGRGK
jgi:hypothetical protein